MNLLRRRQPWVNLLTLLSGTTLTLLTIAVAFLRFYRLTRLPPPRIFRRTQTLE